MANPKPEVVFDVGEGEDAKSYTLQLDFNALCAVEDLLDTGFEEVVERLQKRPRLAVLRAVFWAGLRTHHKGITVEKAGLLIGEVGADRVRELIDEAFTKAFPKAEEANATEDPPVTAEA